MELWLLGGLSAAILLLGSGSTKSANSKGSRSYSDGSNWDEPELLHKDWEDARDYTAIGVVAQSRRDEQGKWEFRYTRYGERITKEEVDRLYKEKY